MEIRFHSECLNTDSLQPLLIKSEQQFAPPLELQEHPTIFFFIKPKEKWWVRVRERSEEIFLIAAVYHVILFGYHCPVSDSGFINGILFWVVGWGLKEFQDVLQSPVSLIWTSQGARSHFFRTGK